ncbi:MAG: crotonase/enoyl-CoA hydratase family protein [Pseudomonadota bacterium]
MGDRITITQQDGVADLRLARPEKMNALDPAMFDALVETAAQLDADRSVRCVVLSGEGASFCAGLDMASFQQFAAGERLDLATRTHGDANLVQQSALAWRRIRPPVIAAVHGAALGGGFQIIMGADIRIIHPEAKLSILEVKWGIAPDLGGTTLFTNVAREDVVRELTYTGRFFSGAEAAEYGFATRLSETPHEAAMTLAREIAAKSPDAVQTSKRLFNAWMDAGAAAQLALESELQETLIGTPNQIEAVMSGLQKRAAQFKD